MKLFAKDRKVGFVRRKTEHDEVGVGTVQDVTKVRVVLRALALLTDEIHNLVLAFTRDGCVGQHGKHTRPPRVRVQPVKHVPLECE
jgi:hypothetical protein